MTKPQREALAKWAKDSGSPYIFRVNKSVARALIDLGYLQTQSTLAFTDRKMVLCITNAGLAAHKREGA